ncbi:MAG: CBS domain-containing protein [Candidatus Anstonellaceae archaeon]
MEIEQPSVLDASSPVSKAIYEISKTGLPVFVTKNGKYFGLIDERSIRQRTHDPSKEKCETIAEKTPILSGKSTVMDACKAFFAGRFKAIPVIENGKILGAITRHTLLNELLKEKMLSRKRVAEVMTSPVATIEIESSIGQARSELRKHNIRRLVVTQGGKIAGLLSVFDLASHIASQKQSNPFYMGGEKTSMDSQPILPYVKREVETASESDSLAEAVRKMLEKKVSALVVSKSNVPVGIVTAKDILHAAISDEGATKVFVSGLPFEQREYQSIFVSEGEKLLSKIGKSFQVRTLAFHVKQDGSGFSIRARLDGKNSYNASASAYKLDDALRKVLSEIRRMVEKDKSEKVEKRKRLSRKAED